MKIVCWYACLWRNRIPLGENFHSKSGTVSNGTYIGFIVLTFFGAVLAWTLVDAHSVVRHDGSHVILMKHPSWQSELLGLVETLKSDTWILLLFPMFFASNWFYTYQFNGVNAAKFNIRTRALNNVLYYLSQILGAYVFGYALDTRSIRRVTKARIVWVVLFVFTMVVWGGGYAFQKQYTRAETSQETYVTDDWTTSGYVGPMFLYMFYGFYDGRLARHHLCFLLTVFFSRLADDSILVYGGYDKQRQKIGQFRGVLQGHPISRSGHLFPH